jgi:hypothetical protein
VTRVDSHIEVTLTWGSNTLTYSNRLDDTTLEYEGVANSPQVGQDEECRITLPEDSPFDGGEPVAPITAVVVEYTKEDFAITPRTLYVGQVQWIDTNYQGVAGKTSLRLARLIDRLDVPTGVECDRECAWKLFRGACGALIASHEQAATITGIAGYVVSIPGLAAPMVTWARGYVEVDGLRIGIHTQTGDDFTLITAPPAAWDGAACSVVPGCRGTIEDCRDYGQEEFYMALGRDMADEANPTY